MIFMICRKCGSSVADGSRFCPVCGAKTETITVTGTEVKDENDKPLQPAAETAEKMGFDAFRRDEPIVHDSMPSANASSPYGGMQSESHSSYYSGPVGQAHTAHQGMPDGRVVTNSPSYAMCRTPGDAMGARTAETKKVMQEKPREKKGGFFGVGAFVLCVFMIAILAMSTGVFAFLYFRTIGLI